MNTNTLFALAAKTASTDAQQGAFASLLPLLLMVGLFAVMYFIMIRPQKKKQKKEQEMRNNVQIGDEIITIGGFYGKVCAIKDDDFIIESVVDGTKQKIVKSALQTVLTIHDDN